MHTLMKQNFTHSQDTDMHLQIKSLYGSDNCKQNMDYSLFKRSRVIAMSAMFPPF